MTHLVPVLRPVLGTPFRRGSLYRAAGEVPSFHIAPARTQNARDLITGSVLGTYNSASPAWAVGPDGVLFQPAANAPVIEYDAATLQCLGARIWGVVANQAIASEDFSAWGRVGILAFDSGSLSNATLGPSDMLTADKIVENTSSGNHLVGRPLTITATSQTVTLSIFAKKAERSIIYMQGGAATTWAAGTPAAFFDLNAGTAYSSTGVTAVGILAFPNGYYRCFISATTAASGVLDPRLNVYLASSGTTLSYVGDGTSGLYLWGAQANLGPLAPYVPTTTTTASSTADVWDILSLTAGINNLKTLYFRGRTQASGTRGIASLNDNSSSNRLELSTSGTDPKATAVTSGSTVADLNGGTIAANSTFRLAVRFDTDSYALSLNGGAVTTDTSGARALVDRLFIGRDQAGNYQNGYLEEFAGWTKACTDAQVAALAAS